MTYTSCFSLFSPNTGFVRHACSQLWCVSSNSGVLCLRCADVLTVPWLSLVFLPLFPLHSDLLVGLVSPSLCVSASCLGSFCSKEPCFSLALTGRAVPIRWLRHCQHLAGESHCTVRTRRVTTLDSPLHPMEIHHYQVRPFIATCS